MLAVCRRVRLENPIFFPWFCHQTTLKAPFTLDLWGFQIAMSDYRRVYHGLSPRAGDIWRKSERGLNHNQYISQYVSICYNHLPINSAQVYQGIVTLHFSGWTAHCHLSPKERQDSRSVLWGSDGTCGEGVVSMGLAGWLGILRGFIPHIFW